jgi:hypothetical protein
VENVVLFDAINQAAHLRIRGKKGLSVNIADGRFLNERK